MAGAAYVAHGSTINLLLRHCTYFLESQAGVVVWELDLDLEDPIPAQPYSFLGDLGPGTRSQPPLPASQVVGRTTKEENVRTMDSAGSVHQSRGSRWRLWRCAEVQGGRVLLIHTSKGPAEPSKGLRQTTHDLPTLQKACRSQQALCP